jgi:hypothetical protein
MSALGAAVADNGFRPGGKGRSKAAVGGRPRNDQDRSGFAGYAGPTPARVTAGS